MHDLCCQFLFYPSPISIIYTLSNCRIWYNNFAFLGSNCSLWFTIRKETWMKKVLDLNQPDHFYIIEDPRPKCKIQLIQNYNDDKTWMPWVPLRRSSKVFFGSRPQDFYYLTLISGNNFFPYKIISGRRWTWGDDYHNRLPRDFRLL